MTKKPKIIEISPDETAGASLGVPSVKSRLTDVENQTKAIYWVGVIGLVGVIVACFALVIDQMHFNNQTYRDQSTLNELKIKELNTRIDTLTEQLNNQKTTDK